MGTAQFTALLLTLLIANLTYASNDNTVILLSWDGMRHDFLDLGDFPALKRIEREGIRAGRLTPVSPSNTFPGHVSLATGTTPEVHGIIDNVFYDRDRGMYAYSGDASWLNAEPLWIAAERQGVKTATYFWVGSESDWRGQGTSYRIEPFDGNRPESEKVDQYIEWLDLPESERPKLIVSYWRGADSVAHMKGPDHPDVVEIIREQDAELSRLLSALDSRDLWSTTTIIIVSDHGMTEVNESVSVKQSTEDAGFEVRITGGSSRRHIFLSNETDREGVLAVLNKQANIKIYQNDNLPESMYTPNRTGDIVITTEAPNTFSGADTLFQKAIVALAPLLGWKHGAHGFNPDLPDMGGIFLAKGRGVQAGREMPVVHQLDVAPTVTKLLGIGKPKHAIREGLNLSDAP